MNPKAAKQSMFMIFGGYVMLTGLLLVVIPSRMPLSVFSIGSAGLGAALSIYWSLFRVLPDSTAQSLHQFQTNILISLAGAEFVMLAGTFIGSAPNGPWPFALVSWALMFGLVLPRLLRYWRRVERGS